MKWVWSGNGFRSWREGWRPSWNSKTLRPSTNWWFFSDTQARAFSIIIDKNVSDKDDYCRWMQRIQYSITTITVFISLWSGTCALWSQPWSPSSMREIQQLFMASTMQRNFFGSKCGMNSNSPAIDPLSCVGFITLNEYLSALRCRNTTWQESCR